MRFFKEKLPDEEVNKYIRVNYACVCKVFCTVLLTTCNYMKVSS